MAKWQPRLDRTTPRGPGDVAGTGLNLSDQSVTTWPDVVGQRAAAQGEELLYRFLIDGEQEQACMTYGQLDRRARAVGALLQEVGVAGERALLLYPAGLEFIAALFGCMYSGVIAVPTFPPNSVRHVRALERVAAIVTDARPGIVLTTSGIRAIVEAAVKDRVAVDHILTTDGLDDALADRWDRPELTGETVACLQYTSGSTASPKGVVLSHANLLHNSAIIQDGFGHSADSRGVIWVPPYHDMGLIGGVLQPLYVGFPVTLMSPTAFLQRPIRWLEAVTRYGGTTSGGPNFAYELCVDKTTDAQRTGLDLSTWTVAFNGAEVVHHETLEKFARAFETCGFRRRAFYSCYGLAEATLMVSGCDLSSEPVRIDVDPSGLESHRVVTRSSPREGSARTLASSGRPREGQAVRIVDPQTCRPCPPDAIGEVWVAGHSVALGYWGNEQETAQAFNGRLVDSEEGPYLRTGDLGFLHGGELFVTGRLKDLLVIHGANHYPQDIERTVQESHEGLAPGRGAVFSVDVDQQEQLVIVQEVARTHRRANADTILAGIREAVSKHHELMPHAVVLAGPGQVPMTSSGKVQRRECRGMFLAGIDDPIACWTQDQIHAQAPDEQNATPTTSDVSDASDPAGVACIEKWLVARLSAAIGIPGDQIDPNEPFARYGLDSISAVEIAMDTMSQFAVELGPRIFWDYPSPSALARHVGELRGSSDPPVDTLTQQANG